MHAGDAAYSQHNTDTDTWKVVAEVKRELCLSFCYDPAHKSSKLTIILWPCIAALHVLW